MQQFLGQDIVDGFDDFEKDRNERNNQQVGGDQGLDASAFSDAGVVPNVEDCEKRQEKEYLHPQFFQGIPKVGILEISPQLGAGGLLLRFQFFPKQTHGGIVVDLQLQCRDLAA